ncbi:lactosylceramide 4-alpha-galactosyltransferase-like [Haemaphysalis longicornis]
MRRCENNATVYRAIAIACCVILLVGLAWLYESCLQYSNGRHTFGQLISRQRFFLRRWRAFDNTLPDESNAIWFIESSNETYLKGRQACAVESASLHNPSLPVVLLTTGQLSPDGGYYEALQSLQNFRALTVNLTDVFNDTPLDLWYQSRNWTSGPYRIEDLSDGVRLAVLWKRGGTYLDLDIIVMKSLGGLSNSVMFEVTGQLTNSVLFFDREHPFIEKALRRCALEYNSTRWGSCGPSLLGRLYYSWNNMPSGGLVKFRDRDSFFAVGYTAWMSFFEPSKTGWVFETVAPSYGVHLWNKLSHGVRAVVGSGSALDVLARFNCPRVYEVMVSQTFF